MAYAEGTTVSPERSKAEIETLLRKYGADQFASGWGSDSAFIGFRCKDRLVRFVLPFPVKTEERFLRHKSRSTWQAGALRSPASAREAWEQEIRRRWRALALCIKGKLEAVETGITTFETEFAMHIVLPDGKSVGDHVLPAIENAYATGKVRALLPQFTS